MAWKNHSSSSGWKNLSQEYSRHLQPWHGFGKSGSMTMSMDRSSAKQLAEAGFMILVMPLHDIRCRRRLPGHPWRITYVEWSVFRSVNVQVKDGCHGEGITDSSFVSLYAGSIFSDIHSWNQKTPQTKSKIRPLNTGHSFSQSIGLPSRATEFSPVFLCRPWKTALAKHFSGQQWLSFNKHSNQLLTEI